MGERSFRLMDRKRFIGVLNIIRFNWHQFLIVIVAATVLLFLPFVALKVLGLLALFSVLISLLVSYWVYDVSDLYKLKPLNHLENSSSLLNIHSGFDETSAIIQEKFPQADLVIADFYNPQQHTEISIKRARKLYPASNRTVIIETTKIPFEDERFDAIFLIFAAHEIRESSERECFFKEVDRVLAKQGKVIVTEHLRDIWNGLAYNIGSLHFHSRKSWLDTFAAANFQIESTIKTTPFVTTFVLRKNGIIS